MNVLFLADAMLPREAHHNLSVSNDIQYSSIEVVKSTLVTVPHGTLLGPVLLSTIIKNAGHHIQLLECAFHPHQAENLLRSLKGDPDVVCLSTTYIMDYAQLKNYVTYIRKHAPRSKIILGGPSLTEDPQKRSLGDFFVLGEGEQNIVPLLECIGKNQSPEIPGVGFFINQTPYFTPAKLTQNMDDLPFADWSLTRRKSDDFYMLATQRGCHWRCTFCTYPINEGYKLRYRSTENILAEIKRNHSLLGIHKYMFTDATFSFPIDRCREILVSITKLPFKIQWAAYVRADTITIELAETMKKSGCIGVFLGLESGDENILKRMNKGYGTNEIRRGVHLLKKQGIPITASWVIGFPGETKESATNTLNLIKDLRCEQNMINTFTCYNTSPTGLRPQVFGLEGHGQEWKHQTMNSNEARELTRQITEDLILNDVNLGNLFDFLWLSSVGFSTQETIDFFSNIQKLWKSKLVSNKDADKINHIILQTCKNLYSRSIHHPIYNGPTSKIPDANSLNLERENKQ